MDLTRKDSFKTQDTYNSSTCARDGQYEIEIRTDAAYPEPTTDESINVVKTEILVAGTTANKYISTAKPNAVGPIPDYSEEVFINKGSEKYIIHFDKNVSEEVKTKMLSTFRFD